jgi:hypothetical protein
MAFQEGGLKVVNPMGRPIKYKDEFAEELLKYFSDEVVSKIETITSGSNSKGGEWSKTEVRYEALYFPTLELFANSIGVNGDTLVRWAGKYPNDFSDESKRGTLRHPDFYAAYTRAKEIQKGLLLQYALIGKLNPGFAQFFAVNNLGMQSKSLVEQNETVTHKFEDMTDEQLDAAIKTRQARAS